MSNPTQTDRNVLISAPMSERKLERQLAERLSRFQGIKVLRAKDIAPGENLGAAMRHRVRTADLVVSLVPESAQESSNVFIELGAAKMLDKLRLAVLLHDIGHLPFSHTADEKVVKYDGDVDAIAAQIVGMLKEQKGRTKTFRRRPKGRA